MSLLRNVISRLPPRVTRGLRHFADSSHRTPGSFEQWASARNPLKGRMYSDFTDFEQETLRLVPDVVATSEAVIALLRAVQHVEQHRIPGAFVECGVYRGGNLEVMIRTLQHLNVADRDVYAYDTFAGMPRPTKSDVYGAGDDLHAMWEANRTEQDGDNGSNWMRAPLDLVQQRILRLGYPHDKLHFVQGLVEQTIPGVIPDRIAILRLDTDFYTSTKHELQHLYPRLSPGGVLIIDDYGAMDGCRLATDEYADANGTGWFLSRVDAHVRLTIKR